MAKERIEIPAQALARITRAGVAKATAEQVFMATIQATADALEVPNNWVFDAGAGVFVPPPSKKGPPNGQVTEVRLPPGSLDGIRNARKERSPKT